MWTWECGPGRLDPSSNIAPPFLSQEDSVINFITRMVLILSDAKDDEMAVMHTLATGIMVDAVNLWPMVRDRGWGCDGEG